MRLVSLILVVKEGGVVVLLHVLLSRLVRAEILHLLLNLLDCRLILLLRLLLLESKLLKDILIV